MTRAILIYVTSVAWLMTLYMCERVCILSLRLGVWVIGGVLSGWASVWEFLSMCVFFVCNLSQYMDFCLAALVCPNKKVRSG